MEAAESQLAVFRRFGVSHYPCDPSLKVGIAAGALPGRRPLHGERYPPVGNTTGWYLWAGDEPTKDPDLFFALHAEHLPDRCPAVIPYLGLPPGCRFLIALGHEDVWFDPNLPNSDDGH